MDHFLEKINETFHINKFTHLRIGFRSSLPQMVIAIATP